MTPYENVEDCIHDAKKRRVFGEMGWFRVRASVAVHRAEGSYLITSYGDPVVEVFKDHVILLAPEQNATQYPYAWRKIVQRLFGSEKCSVYRRLNPRTGLSICAIGRKANFISWCVVDNRGDVINTDFKDLVEIVDKEKVKEYNKKLRLFFKPCEVIARLGTHEEQIKELFSHKNPVNLSAYTMESLSEYVISGTPIDFIELIKYVRKHSYWFRNLKTDTVLAKFKTLKENLRLTFARSCTTLKYDAYVPEDKYVKYQSMVLQQTDGLRKVPVYGEVKVRRPRTRASTTSTSRENRTCQ